MKSYRSTFEIVALAQEIRRNDDMEIIDRHGQPPAVIPCKNDEEELNGTGLSDYQDPEGKLIFPEAALVVADQGATNSMGRLHELAERKSKTGIYPELKK